MADISDLTAGLKGRAELVVTDQTTAIAAGSGRARVFATPMMVALMEKAARDAIESRLTDAQDSVGIRIDVTHDAATPVGMRVEATAELIAVEGRTLTFRVEARDAAERIGGGTHVRVLIDAVRFQTKADRKGAPV